MIVFFPQKLKLKQIPSRQISQV